LRQCILVRHRVNQKHRLAHFYRRPLFVQALEQDPANAGPYFNLLGAFGLGNRLRTDRHTGRLYFNYAHWEGHTRGRGGGLSGLIIFAAPAQGDAYNSNPDES
jgi:hypothetical protein